MKKLPLISLSVLSVMGLHVVRAADSSFEQQMAEIRAAREQGFQEHQRKAELEAIEEDLQEAAQIRDQLQQVRSEIMQIPRKEGDLQLLLQQKQDELAGLKAALELQEAGGDPLPGQALIAEQNIAFRQGELADQIKDIEKLIRLRDQETQLMQNLQDLKQEVPEDRWEIDEEFLMPVVQPLIVEGGELFMAQERRERAQEAQQRISQAREAHAKKLRRMRRKQAQEQQAETQVPPSPKLTRKDVSLSMQDKVVAGGIATALALAITTYIGRKVYVKKKERLMKKYKIAALTPWQNSIWRATALAAIGIPAYLRYLVRSGSGMSLAELVGSDPRAVADLYYGHTPSKQELDSFIVNFFKGRE